MSKDYSLKDMQWLLSSPGFVNNRQTAYARQMRSDELPDWMEAAVAHIQGANPEATNQAGLAHTTESMIQDLRQRVMLDSIAKTAAMKFPPLRFEKMAEDTEEMKDYIVRHYLMPNHGQMSIPALFEAVKNKFGVDKVMELGGPEIVMKMLEDLRAKYEKPNLAENLPKYDGSPQVMGPNTNKDANDYFMHDSTQQKY